MPSTNWSKLSRLQLGRYAEYYAKMEFASYGFEVYTSEVDDHGVDFIAKNPHNNQFYEVQVKSIRKAGYVFVQKDKIEIQDNWLLCLMRFVDGALPEVFIIPATTWATAKEPFVSRDYDKEGQKSKPEWGINLSKKNLPKLESFSSDDFFSKWL